MGQGGCRFPGPLPEAGLVRSGVLVCGRCGEVGADGAPFCSRCGSNLGGSTPAPPYPAYPPYPSNAPYPSYAPYPPNGPHPPYPPHGPTPLRGAPSGPPGGSPRTASGPGGRAAIVISIVAVLVVLIGFAIAVTSKGSDPAPDRQGAAPLGGAHSVDPAGPTVAPIAPGPTVGRGSTGSVVPTAPLPFADPGGDFGPTSGVMYLDAAGAFSLQTGGNAAFAGYVGGHNRTWSDTPASLLRITILQFSDARAANGAQATIAAFWQADHRTVQTFDDLPGALTAQVTVASANFEQGIHNVSFTKGPVLVVVRLSRQGDPTDDIYGVALAQYDALG